MIILATLIAGIVVGGSVARKRGGNRLDMLQYATGYAIAFGLVGVFVTIFIDRMI